MTRIKHDNMPKPTFILRASDGSEYCNDGEFRQPTEDLSLLEYDHRPRVFRTKQSASGKARFIGRVTTIEVWEPGSRSGGPL